MGSKKLTAALAGHSRVVVDTAPLIYFLAGDPRRAPIVEEILTWGAAGTGQLVVSVITEAELLVAPLGSGDASAALAIRELLDGPSGFEVVEASRDIARRAAGIRADRGLGLADAMVVATGIEARCTALVGNDKALRRASDLLTYLHVDDLTG